MGRVYAVEGMMYSLNDDYDHTIESLKKSIQLVSTCVGTYILLGDAYKEKGDFENAIDALNRAREINPNIAQVYVNLGAIYEEKQDYDRASAYYVKAIDRDPLIVEAYRRQAIIRCKGTIPATRFSPFRKFFQLARMTREHWWCGQAFTCRSIRTILGWRTIEGGFH